jgi:hypothetical protein
MLEWFYAETIKKTKVQDEKVPFPKKIYIEREDSLRKLLLNF